MARIDWKKKWEYIAVLMSDRVPYDLEDMIKKYVATLQRKLERERKKSAEAREPVELLEWAKNTGCISIEIYTDGRVRIYSLGNLVGRSKSLLLALRAAKKIVERQK